LRSSSQIPDRTTIWTFKERLIAAGASESIFDAVNRQLAKHGFIARGGQMIDASFVQVPKQSLNKEEKAIVAQDAMPADWKPAKRRQKDTDARWTKKYGKSYFGYKLSANADKRYKLIRKIKISTASQHDTLHFEEVLDPANTSRDIYADKGYVDGGAKHVCAAKAGACISSAKATRASRCRKRRNDETGGSHRRALASSMCLQD
jgi:transposase, IS5 family